MALFLLDDLLSWLYEWSVSEEISHFNMPIIELCKVTRERNYITISKSDIKSNTMTYFLFVFDRVKTEYRPGRQILTLVRLLCII